MPAVAYLRKSRVTSDRSVSWEVQEAAIRELAAAQGDVPIILSDWNKSGRRGADGRPGYRRLLEMIESGEATSVYSYSLSRLSRSMAEFTRLVELAAARGIPIRLHVERDLAIDTATGRMIVSVLGALAQMEAEIAQERARDAIEARRARGDRVGGIRYGGVAGEDLAAVIAAFKAVGTYRGAANRLTAQGVPTRRGRAWLAPTVRNILLQAAPELVPARGARGASTAPRFRFARLLRCPYDGKLLTGMNATPGQGRERYGCTHAYAVADHGSRYVAESKVLPWIRDEVARLQTPGRVEVLAGQDRKRSDLEARRARILDMFETGDIDKAEKARRLERIDSAVEVLDTERRIVEVPEVDWTWPPETINLVLRSMFEYIELGPDLHPIRAEWLVPEWRGEG